VVHSIGGGGRVGILFRMGFFRKKHGAGEVLLLYRGEKAEGKLKTIREKGSFPPLPPNEWSKKGDHYASISRERDCSGEAGRCRKSKADWGKKEKGGARFLSISRKLPMRGASKRKPITTARGGGKGGMKIDHEEKRSVNCLTAYRRIRCGGCKHITTTTGDKKPPGSKKVSGRGNFSLPKNPVRLRLQDHDLMCRTRPSRRQKKLWVQGKADVGA